METVISVNIDNLIRGYCSNFLSYLYATNGWKRTMFEMGKEIFIPSYLENKEIRIVIMNTGVIILTCYNIHDVLISMEFIISQFEYGNMISYIVFDEDVNVKTSFTTTILLDDFYYSEKGVLNNSYGKISISEGVATLTSDSYENYCELTNIVHNIYVKPINMLKMDNKLKKQNVENDSYDEIIIEKILFSMLFLWAGIKILEYV